MKPVFRTWMFLLMLGVVFVAGMFWVRAQGAERLPHDPTTSSQAALEKALGFRISRDTKNGTGLEVETISVESPAAKAGLQQGDRIIALGDRSVWHAYQLHELIANQLTVSSAVMFLVKRDKEYMPIVFPGPRGLAPPHDPSSCDSCGH